MVAGSYIFVNPLENWSREPLTKFTTDTETDPKRFITEGRLRWLSPNDVRRLSKLTFPCRVGRRQIILCKVPGQTFSWLLPSVKCCRVCVSLFPFFRSRLPSIPIRYTPYSKGVEKPLLHDTYPHFETLIYGDVASKTCREFTGRHWLLNGIFSKLHWGTRCKLSKWMKWSTRWCCKDRCIFHTIVLHYERNFSIHSRF